MDGGREGWREGGREGGREKLKERVMKGGSEDKMETDLGGCAEVECGHALTRHSLR